MAVGFILKGAAFRGTAQFVLVAQSVTQLGYLKGGSDDWCDSFICVVCAAGLHAIHKLPQDRWAYSMALDCWPCLCHIFHGSMRSCVHCRCPDFKLEFDRGALV